MAAFGSLAMLEGAAHACGGCFTPPPPPSESESVITDEKMLLAISMSQTTLYDQISYSGNPASFAWVLPIKGQVTVGLSADVLFQVMGSLTATVVEQPPTNCPPAPTCFTEDGYGEDTDGSSAGSSDDSSGVTVTSQAQVGPYETVQLHSTDGSALTNWLTAHGYQIPDSTKPIIDAYVTGGFDFLALKLVPGQGVQSMQPVRVTSQGAAPSLPLHMVAVGTRPTTGITIWVVAEGRWEPSNFPTFTIEDSEIAWDWATSSSNYETLRLAKEAALGGRGWQIESSLELSQYTIAETVQTNAEYATVGGYLSAGTAVDGGVSDAGAADASSDEDGDAGLDDPGADDGGASATAATEDLAVLFGGIAGPNVRVTRMRSDVAQSALSVDMSLAASADQSELSNVHTPQIEIGEPVCPVYNETCSEVGTLPLSQIQAQAGQTSNAGASGCATIPRQEGARGTVAAIFALLGVVGVRLRQKRRR
jgi:hypothetical protein